MLYETTLRKEQTTDGIRLFWIDTRGPNFALNVDVIAPTLEEVSEKARSAIDSELGLRDLTGELPEHHPKSFSTSGDPNTFHAISIEHRCVGKEVSTRKMISAMLPPTAEAPVAPTPRTGFVRRILMSLGLVGGTR